MHAAGTLAGIPALIILVSIDVLLRYGFNTPLLWGNEVSALLLMIVFFASVPRCTNENGHIRMELFYQRMGARGKNLADLLSALSGLIVTIFLSVGAFGSSAEMFAYGEGAEMIDIPYWPFAVFMGLCGIFLCARFAHQMWQSLREICDRNEPGGGT
jgi:TRAP-type C4-dicarboxylate transport system permease small subunit